MGLQEHLTEKISDILLELGLVAEVIDKFEGYMEGNIEEQEFFNGSNTIDMNSLSGEVTEQLVKTYKSLERHKADDYMEKYIRTLFKIGGKSTLSIIDKFEPYYYYKDDICKKLLKYKVKPAYIIAYYAGHIVSEERYLTHKFIRFFDGLYLGNEEEFKEAFDMCEINAQMLIAACLVFKDGGKKKEYCDWLGEVITNSMEVLFENNISQIDKESLVKYLKDKTPNLLVKLLKSKTSELDELVDALRANGTAQNINSYILKLLIGVSYTISSQSEVANRFLKFIINLDHNKAFSELYEYLQENRYNRMKKLIDKLQIKNELYIAWMGSRTSNKNYGFYKELKQELDSNKEDYVKAMEMCSGINKAFMASLLWKKGEGIEYISYGEEAFVKEFEDFMGKLNVEKSIYERFIQYLRGESSFEDIKEVLSGLFGKKEFYIYGNDYSNVLFWLKDKSPIFEKAMKVFITIGNSDILRQIYNEYSKGKKTLEYFIELLDNYGAEIQNYLPFLGSYAFATYGNSSLITEGKNLITKLISKDENKVIESIGVCNADTRAAVLEIIFKYNKEKNLKILLEYLGDGSKVVREKIVELLRDYEECHEEVIKSLTSKKQAVREGAINILSKDKNEKVVTALSNVLEVEKSEKIKEILRGILKVQGDLEENEDLNILDYCKKSLKGNKAATLKWLDVDTLPKVSFKESAKLAEDEIIKYMLVCYASCSEIALSSEGKRISEFLNNKDLAELALEVIQRWLNSGAEAKKRWVLTFTSVHGDYRVISILKKNIEDWPQNSRGAIASEAVKALALNGSNEALMIVDNISRKFKFKQVKSAAAVALDFAAKEIGIDMEELSDRIVPDLGFDIGGQRVFDYGERKFTVNLTSELTLEVYDESDKKLKSLPAPSKKDDEEKASTASLEFKTLKKQLKTVVSIQTIRLEMALSTNRKWTKEAFVKLFVQNPIMHQFAIGLVWGVYKEDKLIDTFRYMEDGTFNTKDEDEYEIEEGSIIGLVHPIELNEEDINLWKEQLENYEIKQPFEQINRAIFTVTEEEMNLKRVERFGGIMLNGLSLLGKLTSFGWYKGSIQDAGCYYTFYKEDRTINIGVELNFSGVSVGYENEDVTIFGVTFYKAGTVERGSYVYDTVKENNIIVPSKVDKRFFSEILYGINKATLSKIGMNENWRKDE